MALRLPRVHPHHSVVWGPHCSPRGPDGTGIMTTHFLKGLTGSKSHWARQSQQAGDGWKPAQRGGGASAVSVSRPRRGPSGRRGPRPAPPRWQGLGGVRGVWGWQVLLPPAYPDFSPFPSGAGPLAGVPASPGGALVNLLPGGAGNCPSPGTHQGSSSAAASDEGVPWLHPLNCHPDLLRDTVSVPTERPGSVSVRTKACVTPSHKPVCMNEVQSCLAQCPIRNGSFLSSDSKNLCSVGPPSAPPGCPGVSQLLTATLSRPVTVALLAPPCPPPLEIGPCHSTRCALQHPTSLPRRIQLACFPKSTQGSAGPCV